MTRQGRQFSEQGMDRGRNDDRFQGGGQDRSFLDRQRDDERGWSSRDQGSFRDQGSMEPRYERDEGFDRNDENARFGRNEGRYDQAWSRGNDERQSFDRDDQWRGGRGMGPGRNMAWGGSQGSYGGQPSFGQSSIGSSSYGQGQQGWNRGGDRMQGERGGRSPGDWGLEDRFGVHGDVGTTLDMNIDHRGQNEQRGFGSSRYNQGGQGWNQPAYGLGGGGLGQSHQGHFDGQSSWNQGQRHFGSTGLGQQGYGMQGGMGQGGMGQGGLRSWGSGGGMGQDRPHLGKGPKGYTRSDERIREEVCDCLSDGYVDASGVEVEVKGGVVTLTGTVTEKPMKRQIEDMVEACRGVKTVENQIRVQPQQTSSQGHSTTGQGTQGSTGFGSSTSNGGDRDEQQRGGKGRSSSAS
jgi:hypothetical protein